MSSQGSRLLGGRRGGGGCHGPLAEMQSLWQLLRRVNRSLREEDQVSETMCVELGSVDLRLCVLFPGFGGGCLLNILMV